MKRISVILADDHTIVREGFRKMLELEDDIQIVGEAQNGSRAVELAKKLRPDIVLMDIAMPLLNGLLATRQVLKAVPATRVIILSAHSDDAYVQNATASGAAGFLLKQTSASDVCRAIREVHKGKKFYSPSITKRLQRLDDVASDLAGIPHSRNAPLTARELELVQLIVACGCVRDSHFVIFSRNCSSVVPPAPSSDEASMPSSLNAAKMESYGI